MISKNFSFALILLGIFMLTAGVYALTMPQPNKLETTSAISYGNETNDTIRVIESNLKEVNPRNIAPKQIMSSTVKKISSDQIITPPVEKRM